jgi:lysophospholipase L1-like esterase
MLRSRICAVAALAAGFFACHVAEARQANTDWFSTWAHLCGTVPLVLVAAHAAVATSYDTIDPYTDTALTFGGAASVTIPVGSVAVSDAASFAAAANSNCAASIYTPSSTGAATSHYYSSHYSFAASGDQVSNATMSGEFSLGSSVFFASGLDVAATGTTRGIVAIGDSITDGYGSTFDTDSNWPDVLSQLLSAKFGNVWAVADTGIGGNTLLSDYVGQSGLARFDRDVLALPGVTQVIEAEGINDLSLGVAAADLIAGLQQMINRTHEKRLTIYGATITPASGNGTFESNRQTVNTVIRSGVFDGYLDFDAAIRDPKDPSRIYPPYDSGDHVHPNSAGYAQMAQKYRRL